MGLAVIGGMLAATGIGVFMIPVAFTVIEKLSHKKGTPGTKTEKGDH
jgi:ethanolamine transporter EutH